MTKKRYSPQDISVIRRLRQRYKPEQIAQLVGRSSMAIHAVLKREKKKFAEFPQLRHGNMKHDCSEAQELRDMIRQGMKYKQIQDIKHMQPAVISRVLAAEARGELKW